jgi:hypothetical protein
VVDLILEKIGLYDNFPNKQEMLIRALISAKNSFDGGTLLKMFDDEETPSFLRWAIANTLAEAKVINIEKWIFQKLQSSKYASENERLFYALPKFYNYKDYIPIFRRDFANYPFQIADLIRKYGQEEDYEFLISKIASENLSNIQKRYVAKVIKHLEKKFSR